MIHGQPGHICSKKCLQQVQLSNFLQILGKESQNSNDIKDDEYVELHFHSEHSSLDGATRVHEIASTVKDHGQIALAVTDHGTMSGIFDIYKECKKKGIKLIPGLEGYIVSDATKQPPKKQRKKKKVVLDEEDLNTEALDPALNPDKDPDEIDCLNPDLPKEETNLTSPDWESHVTLLARNKIGYQNLLRLHYLGYQHKRVNTFGRVVPRIDLNILSSNKEGLIVGSGCFLPGAKVLTKEGLISIELISNNLHCSVLNENGEWVHPKCGTTQNVNTDVFTINDWDFEATANHEFLVSTHRQKSKRRENNEFEIHRCLWKKPFWKRADDLSIGDYLLLARPPKRDHRQWLSVPDNRPRRMQSRFKRFPNPLPITKELMYLLGWFTAKGSTNQRTVIFSLSTKELPYLEEILKLHIQIFGLKGEIKVCQSAETCTEVRIISTMLVDFYTYHIGKGSKTKQLSTEILEAQYFEYFLKGYFLGDGSCGVYEKKIHNKVFTTFNFTYATSSPILANQLDLKIMEYGFKGSRWEQIPSTSMHPAYYWSVSGEAALFLDKFLRCPIEKTPLFDNTPNLFNRSSQKVNKLIEIDNKQYFMNVIKTINKRPYIGQVYCMQVEGNSPSFSLERTTVHNCLGSQINQALIRGATELADSLVRDYVSIFGEFFYIEMMPIGLLDDDPKFSYRNRITSETERLQFAINKRLAAYASKYSLPTIITADAHYAQAQDKETHALLLATQSKKELSDEKCFYFPALPMQKAKILANQFPIEWIRNTRKIADLCDDPKYLDFGKDYKIPKFDIPNDPSFQEWKQELKAPHAPVE